MKTIYEPAGKAREYSLLALNIYMTCTHHCKYCYAPNCMFKTEEEYFKKPLPRKEIAKNLEAELIKNGSPKKQVLLSFIGDVYSETQDENKATRDCLEILLKYDVPVAILTKGGKRCLKDLDVFKEFKNKIQIGATLTFDNDKDSLEWESGAALPQERLETLKILHENGIRTFASFEPVIIPSQSLNLMKKGLGFIDVYKIGKINNYKNLDKAIDWNDFLNKAVDMLRKEKKEFYIKYDLRKSAPMVKLCEDEAIADKHNVS